MVDCGFLDFHIGWVEHVVADENGSVDAFVEEGHIEFVGFCILAVDDADEPFVAFSPCEGCELSDFAAWQYLGPVPGGWDFADYLKGGTAQVQVRFVGPVQHRGGVNDGGGQLEREGCSFEFFWVEGAGREVALACEVAGERQ